MRTHEAAGRLLQWHQLKQVGGLLIAAVTFEAPGVAAKLAAMPATQVTQILRSLSLSAEEADRLTSIPGWRCEAVLVWRPAVADRCFCW